MTLVSDTGSLFPFLSLIRSHGHKSLRFHRYRYTSVDHCYPTSFVSNNDKISTRLQLLLTDTLLGGVRRFCGRLMSWIPRKNGGQKRYASEVSPRCNVHKCMCAFQSLHVKIRGIKPASCETKIFKEEKLASPVLLGCGGCQMQRFPVTGGMT